MLNQIILVGRLTSDPKINEVEEKKSCIVTLAIPRSYKNADGIYETDFVPVTITSGIMSNVCDYCRKGDIIGVKGRIETRENKIVLLAERVTFLSSRASEINQARKEEEDGE